MMPARGWLIAIALVVSGCGESKDSGDSARASSPNDARCERAVGHLFEAMNGGREMASDEKRIAEAARSLALSKCKSEGLSVEQAECIMAVDSVGAMMRLGSCPAIRENKPSWLISR